MFSLLDFKQRGFTLIELLIVIVILGVLAALAIPMYTDRVASARRSTCQSNLQLVLSTAMLYSHEHNGALPTMADLVTAGELRNAIVCPTNGSQYLITATNGVIQVACPNAADGHILP